MLENLALRTGVVVHVRIEGKGLAWQQAVGLVLSIQYRNMRDDRMILRFDSQPRNGPVPYALSAASFSGLSQQANLLRKNNNYAYLHTLACLDAARGETAEARQLLLEAMSTGNMEEPNSAIWYGFGRIYEQYGVYDAAAAAYQRVERPDGVIEPTDTFVLAQSRLKALHRN